ncbi:MAG: hypothetical protein IPP06_12630 [Saprospiraceae bacterium]|nr:hypothetical protein [Candidatus Vicinibacter affinis]
MFYLCSALSSIFLHKYRRLLLSRGGNQVECSSGMWIEKVVGNPKSLESCHQWPRKKWIDVKGFDLPHRNPMNGVSDLEADQAIKING